MSIPQSVIDDILARIDIVDVIRPRVPLKRAGREWQACCPFHNEKSPSFSVSPKKQFYYCFGCHASGNALRFLMEFEHLPFRDAIEQLASMAGVPLPDNAPVDDHAAGLRREEREALLTAQKRYQSLLAQSPAAAYLQQRQVNAAMIERYALGYAPAQGGLAQHVPSKPAERAGLLLTRDDGSLYERFRNRLMFPIRDARGQVVGFGGRTLVDDKAKYLNSPETPLFHKGRLLYGLYEARQARRDLPGLLVVEGYMDVIALAQYGIDYAVATLGTAATAAHLEQMLRVHPRITFCFDGDKAGRRAAAHALEVALPLVRDGHQLHFLFLPEGHDPDTWVREIGADAFAEHVQQAPTLSAYLLQELQAGLNLDTIEDRAVLSERAKEALRPLRAPALKEGLLSALAQRSSLSTHHFEASAGPESARPAPALAQRQPAPRRQRESATLSRAERALLLLLHWPELAQLTDAVESIAASEEPGAPLLAQIVDTLHAEPTLHFGALIGRMHSQDDARTLERLGREEPEIDTDSAREEFVSLLCALLDLDPRARLRALSDKARRAPLSPEETQELSHLIRTIASNEAST